MILGIEAIINKKYCNINTVKFYLKDGGTITLDRDETEVSIKKSYNDDSLNVIHMKWKNVYLWSINDQNIFGDKGVYIDSEDIINLLDGSIMEIELEEDNCDPDYEMTNISWIAEINFNTIGGVAKDIKKND